MSFVNSEALKSASNPLIPFITRTEDFTTAQIRHDSLIEFGLLVKAIKITNNDPLANVTVRTQSPSGALITIDPSSELIIDGWTSYFEINPNAVSGTGQIEFDLVIPSEARK